MCINSHRYFGSIVLITRSCMLSLNFVIISVSLALISSVSHSAHTSVNLRFIISVLQAIKIRINRRIVDAGHHSKYRNAISGFPQGTVLGPLRFILYEHDMWFGLENKLVAYADDATLFASTASLKYRPMVAESRNRDLVKINEWCKLWSMELITNKAQNIGGDFKDLGVDNKDLGIDTKDLDIDFKDFDFNFKDFCVYSIDLGVDSLSDNWKDILTFGADFKDLPIDFKDNCVNIKDLGVDFKDYHVYFTDFRDDFKDIGAARDIMQVQSPYVVRHPLRPSMEVHRRKPDAPLSYRESRNSNYPVYGRECFSCATGTVGTSDWSSGSSSHSSGGALVPGPIVRYPSYGVPQSTSSRQEFRSEQKYVNGQPVYELHHERKFQDGKLVHEERKEKGGDDFGLVRTPAMLPGGHAPGFPSVVAIHPGIAWRTEEVRHKNRAYGSQGYGSGFASGSHGSEGFSSSFDAEVARLREDLHRQVGTYRSQPILPTRGGIHRTEFHTQTRYVNGKPVYVKKPSSSRHPSLYPSYTSYGDRSSGSRIYSDDRYSSSSRTSGGSSTDDQRESFSSDGLEERHLLQSAVDSSLDGDDSYAAHVSTNTISPESSRDDNLPLRQGVSDSSFSQTRSHSVISERRYGSRVDATSDLSSSIPRTGGEARRVAVDLSSSSHSGASSPSHTGYSEGSDLETTSTRPRGEGRAFTVNLSSSSQSGAPSGGHTGYGQSSRVGSAEREYSSVYGRGEYSSEYEDRISAHSGGELSSRRTSSSTEHRQVGIPGVISGPYTSHEERDYYDKELYDISPLDLDNESPQLPPVENEINSSAYPAPPPVDDRTGDSGESLERDHDESDESGFPYGSGDSAERTLDAAPDYSHSSYLYNRTHTIYGTLVAQPSPAIDHTRRDYSRTSTVDESQRVYPATTGSRHYRYNETRRHSTIVGGQEPSVVSGSPLTSDCTEISGCTAGYSQLSIKSAELRTRKRYINGQLVGITHYHRIFENGKLVHENITEQGVDDLTPAELQKYGISELDLMQGSYEPESYSQHHERRFEDGQLVHENPTEKDEDDLGLPADDRTHLGVGYAGGYSDTTDRHEVRQSQHMQQHVTSESRPGSVGRSSETRHVADTSRILTKPVYTTHRQETRQQQEYINGQPVYDLHQERRYQDGSLVYENRTELDEKESRGSTGYQDALHSMMSGDSLRTVSESSYGRPTGGSASRSYDSSYGGSYGGSSSSSLSSSSSHADDRTDDIGESLERDHDESDESGFPYGSGDSAERTLEAAPDYSHSSYLYNRTHTIYGTLVAQPSPAIDHTRRDYSRTSTVDESQRVYPATTGSRHYRYNETRRHSTIVGGKEPAVVSGSPLTSDCTEISGCTAGYSQLSIKSAELRTRKRYTNGQLVGITHYHRIFENGKLVRENITEQGVDDLTPAELQKYGISELDLMQGSYEPESYSQHHERRFEDGQLVHENRTEKDEDDLGLPADDRTHLGVGYAGGYSDATDRHEVRQSQHMQQHVTSESRPGNVGRSYETRHVADTSRILTKPVYTTHRQETRQQQEYINGQPVYDLHHERRYQDGSLVYENRTELDEKESRGSTGYQDALHSMMSGDSLRTVSESSYGRPSGGSASRSYDSSYGGSYGGSSSSSLSSSSSHADDRTDDIGESLERYHDESDESGFPYGSGDSAERTLEAAPDYSHSSYLYNRTHTIYGTLVAQPSPAIDHTRRDYSRTSAVDESQRVYPATTGSRHYRYNETRRHSTIVGGKEPAVVSGSPLTSDCTEISGCTAGYSQLSIKSAELRTRKRYTNGQLVGITHYHRIFENGKLVHENITEQGVDDLTPAELQKYGISELDLMQGSYEPESYSQHHERRFEDGQLVHENRTEKEEDDLGLPADDRTHLGVGYAGGYSDATDRHEVRQSQHMQQHVTSESRPGNVGRSYETRHVADTSRILTKPVYTTHRQETRQQQEYINGQPVYDLHHERRYQDGSLVYENRTELDEKESRGSTGYQDALHSMMSGDSLRTVSESSYGRPSVGSASRSYDSSYGGSYGGSSSSSLSSSSSHADESYEGSSTSVAQESSRTHESSGSSLGSTLLTGGSSLSLSGGATTTFFGTSSHGGSGSSLGSILTGGSSSGGSSSSGSSSGHSGGATTTVYGTSSRESSGSLLGSSLLTRGSTSGHSGRSATTVIGTSSHDRSGSSLGSSLLTGGSVSGHSSRATTAIIGSSHETPGSPVGSSFHGGSSSSGFDEFTSIDTSSGESSSRQYGATYGASQRSSPTDISGCLSCVLVGGGSGYSGHGSSSSYSASHGYSSGHSSSYGGDGASDGYSQRKELEREEYYEDGQLVRGREEDRSFRDGQLIQENRRVYSGAPGQIAGAEALQSARTSYVRSSSASSSSSSSSHGGSEGYGADAVLIS
ncbi:serine-rich adhesin for platelets-like [Palaemon carinicauda]|uniref:serine-rich adhesin for platelets-like n=1 Tax=Palaemon carinicauda TaxID=392227 RepID=UPI0035B65945